LIACLSLIACSSVYYDAQERILGKQKRHILRDRVEAGQADQNEAQEQFKTTLELFKEVTRFEGGELESFYKKLQSEYDDCEARAKDVRERIGSIEKVAGDLFSEWEGEISLMQNPDLKGRSRQSLQDTQSRYQRYIAAMARAENKMDPVLTAFRDQVLFLKHNLNARAIASLKRDTAAIEADVDTLLGDMQRAIGEAESFLAAMG